MLVTEQRSSQSLGPTTLADGVVFSGFIGKSTTDLPAVKAYRTTNLAVLAVLPISVGGRPGMVSSAVVPVGRAIYFGSGNFFDGTGSGVHAYTLPDRD